MSTFLSFLDALVYHTGFPMWLFLGLGLFLGLTSDDY